MMTAVVIVGMLGASSSSIETVQEVIAEMNHSAIPWTSTQLMEAISGTTVGRDEASVLGPLILAAWEAHRSRPPIEVGDLAAIFEAKRDSIDAVDVEYHVAVKRHNAAASTLDESMTWWVRWWQDQYAVHRSVASTAAGLVNPVDDGSAMAWRTDGERLWFSRRGKVMREVDAASLSMIGIEDSWLGAGGCIGRHADGTARAAEHDLAAMLGSAADGTVVVESSLDVLDDVPVVVLRLGWQHPCWIYLDPARGFSPLRIDRWLEVDKGSILARTEMSEFQQIAGGLYLPKHIELLQYRVSQNMATNNGEPAASPFFELIMHAVRLEINRPIEWGQVLPRWDREPE
jgi:hypothetical protein